MEMNMMLLLSSRVPSQRGHFSLMTVFSLQDYNELGLHVQRFTSRPRDIQTKTHRRYSDFSKFIMYKYRNRKKTRVI